MPAMLTWDNDQQSIIDCAFEGDFDFMTYGVLEGQLPMMIREVPHRVDVILRLTPGAALPNLKGIRQEMKILKNVMPANFGIFVGVGHGILLTNPISVLVASQLLRVLDRDLNQRVRFARSIDHARKAIQRSRQHDDR